MFLSAIVIGVVVVPSTDATGCWGPSWGGGHCTSLFPRPRSCGNYPSPYRHRRSFDLVGDIFSAPIYLNSLFRQRAGTQQMRTQQSLSTFDVSETSEGYELVLDVPGVRAEDISVTLEEGGRVLRVIGERHHRREGGAYSSKFDQLFSINDNEVDEDRISVGLSDGVLRIRVPRKQAKVAGKEQDVRRIPILEWMEGGTHSLEEPVRDKMNESEGAARNPQDGGDDCGLRDILDEAKAVEESEGKGKGEGEDDLQISEEEDI